MRFKVVYSILIIILMNSFCKAQAIPSLYNGIAYGVSYENDNSTIYYNSDFDCSNVGAYPKHGIIDLNSTVYFDSPLNLNHYSSSPVKKIITFSNSLSLVPDYPNIIDTVFNPFVCQYLNYLDTTVCNYDYGLPRIGASYYDENRQLHMVGYVGNRASTISRVYKLRYLKFSSVSSSLFTANDSIILPDSVLQFYDIETYGNQFDDEGPGWSGYSSLILPTDDNQKLVVYASAILDTNTLYDYSYYHPNSLNLIKLDENLNRTYNQQLFSAFFNDSIYLNCNITKHKKINNRIYIEGDASKKVNDNYDSYYSFLLELNLDGILINEFIRSSDWQFSYIDSIENALKDYEVFTTDTTTTIQYYNTAREVIKTITIPQKLIHNFVKTADNKYLFVSYSDNIYNYGYDAYLNVYNSNGQLIKKDLIAANIWTDPGYNPTVFLTIDTFKNVIFYYHQPTYTGGQACASVFQRINTGFQNIDAMNFVTGKVVYTYNTNCQYDSTILPAKNILLELKLNNKTYFTTSDDSGYFRINPDDSGHGKLIVHLEQQRFFTNACTDTFDIFISDTTLNPFVDVLLQANPCKLPKVSVNISTPFLLRCFDNVYTLSLTNETADTIATAYADIAFDDDLIPVDTAFSTATSLGNNTYRFYFQDLLPFQTIRKALTVNVNCSTTILGQAHCVEAAASPYNNCVTFDFPRLSALSQCRNDSVLFTISRNVLPDNYNVNYRIITDDSVSNTGILNFTSTVNTHQLVFANPLGKTLRFESYQIPAYPNEDTIVSISIEGCGNDTFSIGYLTLFPPDDDVPFIDIDCQQNVGSFDPNEKAAQPNGYGDSAYILPNTALEYTIHFQNKGTFDAYLVSISDTLSSYLDIRTFEFIASSHEFTYSIIDSNVLVFTSVNIILPAEQEDTLGSMGFIKFRIAPKENSHNGTIINNKASIVFDYNEAIITNTVSRNINDGFIKVNLISSISNHPVKLKSSVYPNPFDQTATLTFDYAKPTQLRILSLDGRLVQSYQSSTNLYLIDRKSLSNGLYWYELFNLQNELLDNGKLIIQ